jgi:hypothetical protein
MSPLPLLNGEDFYDRSGHVDARDIPAHPRLYPYSHALMVVLLRQIDRIVRLAVSGSDRVEAALQRDEFNGAGDLDHILSLWCGLALGRCTADKC